MINKIKRFIKHYPKLYCLVQYSYWHFCKIKVYLFGTKIDGANWAKLSFEDIKKGFNNLNHPHRKVLTNIIMSYNPESVLEIGCNYCPNLIWLSDKVSTLKGLDINSHAIKEGKKLLPDAELMVGKAEDLSKYKDKSVDVVFSDAVLMYVGSKDIKKVLKEMIRISRKGIILIEWHTENSDTYNTHIGNWTRNYRKLLEKLVPKEQIETIKITKEIWANINWIKQGYIIKVKKC